MRTGSTASLIRACSRRNAIPRRMVLTRRMARSCRGPSESSQSLIIQQLNGRNPFPFSKLPPKQIKHLSQRSNGREHGEHGAHENGAGLDNSVAPGNLLIRQGQASSYLPLETVQAKSGQNPWTFLMMGVVPGEHLCGVQRRARVVAGGRYRPSRARVPGTFRVLTAFDLTLLEAVRRPTFPQLPWLNAGLPEPIHVATPGTFRLLSRRLNPSESSSASRRLPP